MVNATGHQGGRSAGILRGLPVWLCPVGCDTCFVRQEPTGSSCMWTMLGELSTCGFSGNGPRAGGM